MTSPAATIEVNAGCCAQMIGFAVMSIDDNDIGDVIAIGIGTSMLQFKNIVKKPMIWIPPIITSVAIAPISIESKQKNNDFQLCM